MNEILKNFMLSFSEQSKFSTNAYRIGIHGSCFLSEPFEGFCDDGLFLLEEGYFLDDGTPAVDWYIVLVECGNITVYDDIPFIIGFYNILEYYLMCCGSYDALLQVRLYGDEKPYFAISDGKLELK